MSNLALPANNTGLGFHYYPDDLHYRQADADTWVPILQQLGAGWLTLRGSFSRAIPEAFLRALIEADIIPVVHLPVTVGALDMDALDVLLHSYARWGVRYVVVFDRPNTRAAWPAQEWSRPKLINRFLHWLLPVLHAMQRHELLPIFPPLAQGGDYWDTTFLQIALHVLKQRGETALLKSLVFGIYGFTFGRKVSWGQGGAAAWPKSQPYFLPNDSQSTRGFHAFDWYNEIITAELGDPRPMLMLAGGARIADEHSGPQTVSQGWHTSCNLEIATLMLARQLPRQIQPQLPANLLNVAYWLLAGADDAGADDALSDAWFDAEQRPRMVAGELKRLIASRREAQAHVPRPQSKTMPRAHESGALSHQAQVDTYPAIADTYPAIADKSVYHYLLLPTFEWGGSHLYWQVIADYVQRFRPTCGFSLIEARKASHVTILNEGQAISPEQVRSLQQADCKVDQITAATSTETQAILARMVKQGVRFQTELSN